jgi:acetyl coenzyme A synthetase (ADP forming)-like protein
MTTIEQSRSYATDVLLRDGTSLHLRAIRPDDKERLLDHFRRLGPESVRHRFFGVKKDLTTQELERFTEPDFDRHVGLVGTQEGAAGEAIVVVGRYFRLEPADDGVARAEFALAVADEWHGRGAGTVMLEQLSRLASAAGVERFEADVLEDNVPMLRMLAHLGFEISERTRQGVVRALFPVRLTEKARRAGDARTAAASAESVRALLHPKSVALIGASRRPGTIGHALLANLRRDGFAGPLYPVNPEAAEIDGVRTYPSVAAIGRAFDLGVVAVPAAKVLSAVEDCARAGARGVVVISAGFAEMSEEGRLEQDRLRTLVRAWGMRMVGPNCMGVLNTAEGVSLNATFAPTPAPPGNVGMLSQSGALGLAILDYARDLNIGISTFVSVGNKADVSGNDLLAYWKDDPLTDVIALYLESFGNPRRFARLAPEVGRRKPIVAVKSGRSAAGSRAASSHSASLACLDVAVDALFEQAGVIRTNTLEDMFDVVALLSSQPVPKGPRVGVVTNAGGPGILLADACEAQGLSLPELTPETLASLRSFLPPAAGLKNPVDMIASASAEQYERTIAAVAADPNVDSVVVVYVPPLVTTAAEIGAAVARGAGAVPADKPLLTVFLASKGAPPVLATGRRGKLPSYSFPENAARALAAALRYGRWRARPEGTALHLSDEQRTRARRLVQRVTAAGGEAPVWLEPEDVQELLAIAGIEMARARACAPEDVARVADELGYPLVAKAIAPGLVHKSDVGGVALGLESALDVRLAVAAMRDRLTAAGYRLESVLLQRQVDGGLEALVGVVGDPTFGPLIVCGAGGVQVELLRDVSFRLPPVTDLDAAEMIDRLRARPLFDGYRGAPPADRAALVELLQKLSALVEELPELYELDLNPVKVQRPGEGAIVVDARVRVGPPRGA